MSIRLITITLGVVGLVASLGVLAGAGGDGNGEIRTSYHSNGQAKETAHFVGVTRDGECTRWYDDGTLRAEGVFEEGKMVGDWVWMTPDGERDAKRSGVYEQGRRTSR